MEKAPLMVLKSYFNNFDTNGNGTLDRNETREFCYQLGYYLSDEQLDVLFLSVDDDNNGVLSFDEWLESVNHQGHTQQLATLFSEKGKQAADYFRYFDTDKSGKLNIDEFKGLYSDLLRYGLVDASSTPESAIAVLDKDNDGTVEFNEYMAWMGLYQ
eukprot:TRINITY_DN5440_c0_g2_i1.p2 TRINITY_DN5440_c0_g2~~TRINITY_DN5440_c0_g2_i1.p2  ORF type:complete len:175 (+),score=37.17 TRINITY_DN5440_c0_g2_i1:57-527(+)